MVPTSHAASPVNDCSASELYTVDTTATIPNRMKFLLYVFFQLLMPDRETEADQQTADQYACKYKCKQSIYVSFIM